MPNTAKKKQGTPLRQRVKAAAKATAEQQQKRSGGGPAPEDAVSTRPKAKVTKRKPDKQLKEAEEKVSKEKKKETKERKRASRAVLTRRLRRIGIVLAVIVIIVAILYPVGRNYYKMMRQEQRLEAELAAVEERNSQIEDENNELETPEGIENEAREDLGWVQEGDQAAVVTNIDDDPNEGKLPEQVDGDEIRAPSTWYYAILDAFFFVDE